MTLYDWLLFLHVLAAFALGAAIVVYDFVIVSSRRWSLPAEVVRGFRIARVGDVLVRVGAVGTLVFGVWLALKEDVYGFGDAWIIIALVLWFAIGALGARSDKIYAPVKARARELEAAGRDEPSPELVAMLRSPAAVGVNAVISVLLLLLLLDMIFKPGS